MFTDKFIEVPINIYSQKEADLIGVETYSPSIEKIDPFSIRSYYSNLGVEDRDSTTVYFKDGGSLLVYLPINQFEKLLNDHVK